jgi:hypothetical protein
MRPEVPAAVNIKMIMWALVRHTGTCCCHSEGRKVSVVARKLYMTRRTENLEQVYNELTGGEKNKPIYLSYNSNTSIKSLAVSLQAWADFTRVKSMKLRASATVFGAMNLKGHHHSCH